MPVLCTLQDGVATVTLSRPEAMNALDPSLRAELRATWERIAADEAVRCVILTGAGDRAFCAGSDLKTPVAAGSAPQGPGTAGPVGLTAGMDMDTPIVCAVNGDALGGGLELALACDIRIASSTARFALPEVRLGTLAAGGGTQRLPRLVGPGDALRLLLTGDRIDAAEALRLGLVSEVLAPADLLPAARALAGRIARNAPLSVRATKRLVRSGLGMPLEQALEMEQHAYGLLRDCEDRAEGRRAFQEKRPPVFRGR